MLEERTSKQTCSLWLGESDIRSSIRFEQSCYNVNRETVSLGCGSLVYFWCLKTMRKWSGLVVWFSALHEILCRETQEIPSYIVTGK